MAGPQHHGNGPEGFSGEHPRKTFQGGEGIRPAGLEKGRRGILPLGEGPLEFHEVVNTVRHGAGKDGNRGGEGQAQGREEGLPGPPLQVSQGHAEGGRNKPVDPHLLETGGGEVRRRLGPHGFRRREGGRPAHRAEDPQDDGGGGRCYPGGQGPQSGMNCR